MRRFIYGLIFGVVVGSIIGIWWLRRVGAFDDPNSLVGSLMAVAKEAAAAKEAELMARFHQQANENPAPSDQ